MRGAAPTAKMRQEGQFLKVIIETYKDYNFCSEKYCMKETVTEMEESNLL